MSWYNFLKDVFTVGGRLKRADIENRLIKLQGECTKFSDENVRLRQELADLHKQVRTHQEMKYRDNVYWRHSGLKIEGPFCPKCFDGEVKSVRLAERADDRFWRCQVCNLAVEKPGQGSRPTRAETEFDPFTS